MLPPAHKGALSRESWLRGSLFRILHPLCRRGRFAAVKLRRNCRSVLGGRAGVIADVLRSRGRSASLALLAAGDSASVPVTAQGSSGAWDTGVPFENGTWEVSAVLKHFLQAVKSVQGNKAPAAPAHLQPQGLPQPGRRRNSFRSLLTHFVQVK